MRGITQHTTPLVFYISGAKDGEEGRLGGGVMNVGSGGGRGEVMLGMKIDTIINMQWTIANGQHNVRIVTDMHLFLIHIHSPSSTTILR